MKSKFAKIVAVFLLGLGTLSMPQAATLNLGTQPLYLGASIPPLVLLALSKDQQLYKKAYNDYSDLDGDGQFETTYKHTIDYYGYFDPYKCYSYDTTNNWFSPVARPSYTTKPSDCAGNWSGNFLNWVSMSRIDAVRKLLYGGKRSTDTSSNTVLERSYLPPDSHSWAKYYLPDTGTPSLTPAISALTPFNPATTPPTGTVAGSNNTYGANQSVSVSTGTKYFRNATINACVGDQVKLAIDATNYVLGFVNAVSGADCGANFQVTVTAGGVFGAGSLTTGWSMTNLSATGITFCNTTLGATSGADSKSQTNTQPPLIRAAFGNYALWAANERHQCYRFSETSAPGKAASPGNGAVRSNGNDIGKSGLTAVAMDPPAARNPASGPDFRARVKVCVAGALGAEKCKQYPSGNYKPIGLLQTYGDDGQLNFGLISGSYDKNISGGVLRKDIAPFAGNPASVGTSEINYYISGSTRFGDGTFSTNNGIVRFLDGMRIYGYYYGDGTYLGSNGDNCNFQLTNITEGNCTSWGNPMSEIYYEGLRYFSAAGPTSAYGFTYSGSKEAALGLPQYKSTWSSPLTQTNYCAPLNMLVFNASVSGNDENLSVVGSSINATQTSAALTDIVGVGEGVNDATKFFFVGRTDSGAANTTTNNELCSAKNISLGTALGICPEGPTLMGSYHMAGLAYHAHINRIRTDLTVPASDTRSLKVNTYGIQLATNVPQIIVPVPGVAGKKVIIQPAYRLNNSAPQGGGQLVDMKIVSASTTATTATGTVYVNWEDSEQGGDYDQDMWGLIRYTVTSTSVTIETSAIAESTNQPQGFGYIVSGTTQDGPHFHSGIENFNFVDPTGGLGCTNCAVGAGWTSRTYTIGTSTASALQDPLWYASKWGGFKELAETGVPATTPNSLPDLAKEWDSKINATGASCATPPCDGLPDNYFLVSNPLGLETALDKAFVAILTTSSAASVATNSTSLNSGTYVYQARFNPATWSGQLLAYSIDVYGNVASTPAWDASTVMPTALGRTIFTANPAVTTGSNDAIPFQWSDLTAAQQAALNVVPFSSPSTSDTNGANRLAYLRGDQSLEGAASGSFRKRDLTILGDIANSTPAYVGPPTRFSFDTSYNAFKVANASRAPVLYAGGNDGMLHAFSATNGTELMGYIPSQVFASLNLLTDQTYGQRHRYFVDGSPSVEDVKIDTGSGTSAWHTVLVGGLNAGGRGYFALDVTNPSAFTEANASSILMWEFNQSVDADLGYTYAKPIITKMANGKMAAIVGNGYNSTNGKAALFIIYLEGGVDGVWSAPSSTGGINNSTSVSVDFVKIDTGIGSFASPNGMGTVFVADYDGDGVADYIYGGDLRGNMWKFDVSSVVPGNWKVSFPATTGFTNGTPLFVAKDASSNLQPITTPPEVSLHPNGGLLILFGTGKYLESADDQSSATSPYRTQTMYGIWDRQMKNTAVGDVNAVPVSGRTQLMVQTAFTNQTVSGSTYRILTKHQPNYSDVARTNDLYDPNVDATGVAASTAAGQRGWYFDFPNSADTVSPTYSATGTGERMVFAPKLQAGRLIYTTLIPTTTPCESGGTSFLMEVNPLTGGRLDASPLDVNGDGIFNSSDYISVGGVNVAVAGIQSSIGIIPTPTIIGGAVPGNPSGAAAAGCSGDGCVVISPRSFCTSAACTCTDPAKCTVCIAPSCNLCLQGKCEIKTLSGSSGNLITLREKAGAKANLRISWRELIND